MPATQPEGTSNCKVPFKVALEALGHEIQVRKGMNAASAAEATFILKLVSKTCFIRLHKHSLISLDALLDCLSHVTIK